MGNQHSQNRQHSHRKRQDTVPEPSVKGKSSAKPSPSAYAPALETLFQVTGGDVYLSMYEWSYVIKVLQVSLRFPRNLVTFPHM